MEENKQKLSTITRRAYELSMFRRNTAINSTVSGTDLLTRRQEDAITMLTGLELSFGDKDNTCCQEENSNASSSVLFGNNIIGKNATRPIKLPEVSKLPPYTSWIFLDRWWTNTTILHFIFIAYRWWNSLVYRSSTHVYLNRLHVIDACIDVMSACPFTSCFVSLIDTTQLIRICLLFPKYTCSSLHANHVGVSKWVAQSWVLSPSGFLTPTQTWQNLGCASGSPEIWKPVFFNLKNKWAEIFKKYIKQHTWYF